jgi:hypothetical protein
VQNATTKVRLPIYVNSAKDEEEISAAQAILKASPSKMKIQFVPKVGGAHGTSILRSDSNAQGLVENWTMMPYPP